MKKGLFIDRDGTLIEDAGYLHDPNRITLLPGARRAMRELTREFQVFLFTNQSGIGRGYYPWSAAEAVNKHLETLLGEDFHFTAVCMAAESPEKTPVYRKPSPRFILESIRDYRLDAARCWMIGDRISDVRAGLRAGIPAALLAQAQTLDPGEESFLETHAVPRLPSLAAFARMLVSRRDGRICDWVHPVVDAQ